MARKIAVQEASRREVALRAGAIPGTRTDASCTYCGAEGHISWPTLSDGRPGAWVTFSNLEVDHVLPEHLGGTGHPDNLVLACPHCNRSKGHKTLTEWHRMVEC